MKRYVLTWIFLATTPLVGKAADAGRSSIDLAASGDVAALAIALNKEASTESRDSRGWTPLIAAVHAGQTDAVKWLLARRPDVNQVTHEGCSALDFAVEEQHEAIVPLLLEAGADVNGFRVLVDNGASCSALFMALHHHRPDFATALLAHGARLEDRNNRGDTALMEAARLPFVDQVDLLIAKGADVNAHSPGGQTALIYAAYNGHEEIVRRLHDKGADLNATATDSPGGPRYAAMDVASEQGRSQMVEFLEKLGAKPANPRKKLNDQLNLALNLCDYEQAQAALANGASPNEPDSNNVLPINVAALEGDAGIVALLIKAGADVNANPDGDPRTTALAQAREQIGSAKTPAEKKRFERVADLLRKAGAR